MATFDRARRQRRIVILCSVSRVGACYGLTMADDAELLRRYAESHAEDAFAELVRRRIDWVYSIALRQVGGDAHLARDVAQRVFSDLARKAAALSHRSVLCGWLHQSTRFAASDLIRIERRRRAREEEAHMMQALSEDPPHDADWQKLRPVLDNALGELSERERDAVLLRYFEAQPFAQIGETLRITEDAARMRVERALEKLRAVLARRGVTSTSAALGVALANQAAFAAPAGLAAAVSSTAIAGTVTSGAATVFGISFAMTKVKIGIAATVIVASTTVAVREIHATRLVDSELSRLRALPQEFARLRADNERLAIAITASAATDPDAAELSRLSQRVAQLKARPDGVTDAEMKPLSAFQNAGRNTPLAAMETQLWARAAGDADAFAQFFAFTDRTQAKLDAFFAALPGSARAKFGAPEKMLVPMASTWGRLGPPVAVQILGQTDYGLKTMVHAWARYTSGQEAKMDLMFQRYEDGWRVPHTDLMMDGVIDSLDPATGERRPNAK